jgi:hypothetical protein
VTPARVARGETFGGLTRRATGGLLAPWRIGHLDPSRDYAERRNQTVAGSIGTVLCVSCHGFGGITDE